MTRWRKKIGEQGAEKVLAASIAAGLKTQTIKSASLDKVNVDTTVQEKAVAFPTDARLYYRLREKLAALAEKHGLKLRQSYRRVARKALILVGRYGRAGQSKLLRRETRRLKGYLRQLAADLMRKIGEDEALQQAMFQPLHRKHKLYSVHAPEVECIGKGKAHKKYEFGVKVSLVATSKEGFVIGAQAVHGAPYDGHTLRDALTQAGGLAGRELNGKVFVDLGYRGHDYEGPARVNIVGRKLKGIPKALARWMKRRAAIEPVIGHMTSDGRLGRNFLLGKLGDKQNAIFCACGHNLRLMLNKLGRKAGRRLVFMLLRWLVSWLEQLPQAAMQVSASRPASAGIGF